MERLLYRRCRGVTWNGEDGKFMKFNAAPGTWQFVAEGTLRPIPDAPGAKPSGSAQCARHDEDPAKLSMPAETNVTKF